MAARETSKQADRASVLGHLGDVGAELLDPNFEHLQYIEDLYYHKNAQIDTQAL